jgi:uncharacterized protein YndB with AHSA1/START domain
MERGSERLTLEIGRVFSVGPERAFAALTDSDLLARWWGPDGFTIPALDWRPEPGEGYRIKMQPPEGDAFDLVGEFREIDPPRQLEFTFIWEDPDPDDLETVASLELLDLHGSTELTLTQTPCKTEGRRALHRDGWSDSFDKLERLLTDGASS